MVVGVEVVVVEDHQEAMVEKVPIKHRKEKRVETEGQESDDLNPSVLTMIE